MEIWKPITDFETYEISDLGNLRRTLTKELVIPFESERGYLRITLYNEEGKKNYLMHRLVGIYHVPNPLNLPEINHKKGNKKDNRAWMLEWSTRRDNILHSYRVLGNKSGGKNYGKPVEALNLSSLEIIKYDSAIEASQKLKIRYRSILKVLGEKRNKTHDYLFRWI